MSSASTCASAAGPSGLDLDGRAVLLADDSVVPFDGLVLATGSRPRRLPGQDAVPAVRELRTLDDSLALRELIADGTARLVVVGAGFIGLEVAATAHALGCSVTVLEAAEAPLIRGLGTEMGRATTSIHDGIAIRCGVAVERPPARTASCSLAVSGCPPT